MQHRKLRPRLDRGFRQRPALEPGFFLTPQSRRHRAAVGGGCGFSPMFGLFAVDRHALDLVRQRVEEGGGLSDLALGLLVQRVRPECAAHILVLGTQPLDLGGGLLPLHISGIAVAWLAQPFNERREVAHVSTFARTFFTAMAWPVTASSQEE